MPVYLLLQLAYDIALLATLVLVMWWGGADEWHGIFVIVLGSCATLLVGLLPAFNWVANRWSAGLVDLVVLGAFVDLALRSKRYWPLWVTSLQLMAVSMHALSLIYPTDRIEGYIIAQGFLAYPMLAMLILASWRTSRPPLCRR